MVPLNGATSTFTSSNLLDNGTSTSTGLFGQQYYVTWIEYATPRLEPAVHAFDRIANRLREMARKLGVATEMLRTWCDRPWPRAAALPPGPPPVSLEMAALPMPPRGCQAPVAFTRVNALARRHARQAVPARSRRRRRVWER